ncbi:hypothetical protein [Rhodospirillum sp. A1_3_36]|uniref:hypothetical protein n=1 Tax=Rhodospirillum sp. A1_3_36 TaxID=3391666 RepID=UPI0039A650B5
MAGITISAWTAEGSLETYRAHYDELGFQNSEEAAQAAWDLLLSGVSGAAKVMSEVHRIAFTYNDAVAVDWVTKAVAAGTYSYTGAIPHPFDASDGDNAGGSVDGISDAVESSEDLIDDIVDGLKDFLGVEDDTPNGSVPDNSLLDNSTNTSLDTASGQAWGQDAQASSVQQGLLDGGPNQTTELQVGGTLLDGLNVDTADNTGVAAATQIIADGYRPGNANLATDWDRGLDLGPGNVSWWLSSDSVGDTGQGEAGPGDLSWWLSSGAGLNVGNYWGQRTTYTDPLVLDLDGDGVTLTDYSSAPVLFDIDNDGGSKEISGWVGATDGIVVHDLDGDGGIGGIAETLSEYYTGTAGSGGEGGQRVFADGFAALASLDDNADGVFDANDVAWADLRVWVDGNHDGLSFDDANGNGVRDEGEGNCSRGWRNRLADGLGCDSTFV